GFTLIELLVVIAIIAILISLVVSGIGLMLVRANATKDLTNHKTLAEANITFSTDHKGRLLHPRTQIDTNDSTDTQIERFWVRSYDEQDATRLEYDGGPELALALEDGAAFSYIGNIDSYKSPLDPTARLRSYSLSAYIGVENGMDDTQTFNIPGLSEFFMPTLTASQIPQPSNTMNSISEDDRRTGGPNWNGWMFHPKNDLPFLVWYDLPAFWVDGEVGTSNVDGSTDTIRITTQGLKDRWETIIQDPNNSSYTKWTDANRSSEDDYKRFRKKMLPGRIGSILDE
ncbi:MAG: prepilin-type N-terminal cleavage/methylation domain-containing protein, partial [Phycisphaerales bacterium]|nr:prepilin-type N-terminal cleavage/methylation domain-containing protein [Phycisphaerales bacterium]